MRHLARSQIVWGMREQMRRVQSYSLAADRRRSLSPSQCFHARCSAGTQSTPGRRASRKPGDHHIARSDALPLITWYSIQAVCSALETCMGRQHGERHGDARLVPAGNWSTKRAHSSDLCVKERRKERKGEREKARVWSACFAISRSLDPAPFWHRPLQVQVG